MRNQIAIWSCSFLILVLVGQQAISFKASPVATEISQAATAFVAGLDDDQREKVVLPAGSPQKVQWHFIPKDDRKGLQLNEMSDAQRKAADQLLASVLSKAGYSKATSIMELETLLKELQTKRGDGGPIRDATRYYFTVFGDPSTSERWGLSIEGHHLSLNFTIESNRVVSSTPQFFATNPAIVKTTNESGIPLGTRVLRFEETLAFELVQSMSPDQLAEAMISETALKEIRAAGDAQPPQTDPAGIRWSDLARPQRQLLRRLLQEYISAVPEELAAERQQTIRQEGMGEVHFAWAGATVPGIGHYYRVQGPTFLIEFVNTQPDGDGNPANHIHAVWRDMRGDFATPIGG